MQKYDYLVKQINEGGIMVDAPILKAGRSLDRSVARAMGLNVQNNEYAAFDYMHIQHPDGSAEPIPAYSLGAALANVAMWLALRGVAIINEDNHWHCGRLDGTNVLSVEGIDRASYALALCNAVVFLGSAT